MKVAIACDWMIGGGAERVVLELHKMYPDAPIYTSYCSDEWRSKLDGKVVTGFLQKWPFSKARKFLPVLRIWWFGRLDFSDFDLVISSSGAEAKGIKTGDNTVHINYCHAPTHYYWMRYDEYLKNPGFGRLDPLARLGLKVLVGPLRHWDYKAAQRPDHIIANSRFTAQQIKKYYNRDARVINPPVDVERFELTVDEPRRGFVTAGRQTPYKRLDLAVAACTELNLPLVVIGNGPDNRRLKKLAGKSVTFLQNVGDEQMAHYFATSQAFIFPGVDDFGIVAVEAMAAGTPVIAYGQGGSLDYVNSKTGVLFKEQTVKSLVSAIQSLGSKSFKESDIVAQAQQFSADHFQNAIKDLVRGVAK